MEARIFTHKGRKFKIHNGDVWRRTKSEKPAWRKLSVGERLALTHNLRRAGR